MKHLEFSGEYRELIISGKKRVTIRKRVNLKVGDEVYVHCGGEIIGKAKILEVEKKRVDELTDDDAKLDGFKNKDELIKELKRIYGDSAEFYVVKFEFEPSDAINPHEFYYGDADLEEIAIKALEKLKLSENERKILQVFLESGSIRKAATKLGGFKKRGEIRKILRKCYLELKRKNIM